MNHVVIHICQTSLVCTTLFSLLWLPALTASVRQPRANLVSYKNKHKRITHPTYMLRLAYVGLAREVKSQATDDTKLLNLACKGLG